MLDTEYRVDDTKVILRRRRERSELSIKKRPLVRCLNDSGNVRDDSDDRQWLADHTGRDLLGGINLHSRDLGCAAFICF